MAKVVQNEHILKGIEKYQGVRDEKIEKLFRLGNLETETYKFQDGRFLVKFILSNHAILYASEEELLAKINLD
jgi:hypothetical protein